MARVPWIRRATAAAWLAAAPLAVGIALAQSAPAPPPQIVRVGDRAPDFTLVGGDEQTYSLAALHGKKRLVLVVFRGTW